ncbi:hypothetical protein ZWY2020_015024 [Hordeum vulgare]|nr:hypothetical protein ZWY2020_015024 [Hordeum vulgare]
MVTHQWPGPGVTALLLAFAWALCGTSEGDPRTAVAGHLCAQGSAVSGNDVASYFVPAMEVVQLNVSADGFGTYSVGRSMSDPNTMFVLGQCLRDLRPVDCKLCFAEVRSQLQKCYPRVGGRVFLDGCFGRYSNYSFFGEAVGPTDEAVCDSKKNSITTLDGFSDAVYTAVANVTKAPVRRNGYAVGSAEVGGATAFVLAQCWESLNKTACDQCLRAAADTVLRKCVPGMEGRGLYTGCYLRYSTRLFWNLDATAVSGSSGTTIPTLKCIRLVIVEVT